MNREVILTFHIAADEDGSLKLGRVQEFTDFKSDSRNLRVLPGLRRYTKPTHGPTRKELSTKVYGKLTDPC